MTESIQMVVQLLEQLADVHDQLIALGTEKSKALAANEVDAVSGISNRESKLLVKLATLENQRITAVNRYVAERGLVPTSSFKLDLLIQMVFRADEKQALLAASGRLSKAVNELRELNAFNQQLLKLNLDYIQYSLDVLTGPSEEEATYHRPLQSQGFTRQSQFDAKA